MVDGWLEDVHRVASIGLHHLGQPGVRGVTLRKGQDERTPD